jgi:threonylcarbamoyladenosine tRNA methylthiotransferase MtaB
MLSRPATEVIEEIERLTQHGFKEVVLTGVLIGAYGAESGSGGPGFEDLLEQISEIPALKRIRISSIEMRQVTPRLLKLMAEPGAKIVPHLHIPLQAGDNKVLRDMNRPYTKEQYIELCQQVYAEVPDVAITTDIMVGFPTETEELFNSTIEVCRLVGYLKIHAFRFSPRYGTPADKFGDPIPDAEKQRRSACLQEVERETSLAFAMRYLGREVEVLVENKRAREGLWRGLTPNYLTVEFEAQGELGGSLIPVRIDSVEPGRILGTPVLPAGKRALPMAA